MPHDAERCYRSIRRERRWDSDIKLTVLISETLRLYAKEMRSEVCANESEQRARQRRAWPQGSLCRGLEVRALHSVPHAHRLRRLSVLTRSLRTASLFVFRPSLSLGLCKGCVNLTRLEESAEWISLQRRARPPSPSLTIVNSPQSVFNCSRHTQLVSFHCSHLSHHITSFNNKTLKFLPLAALCFCFLSQP